MSNRSKKIIVEKKTVTETTVTTNERRNRADARKPPAKMEVVKITKTSAPVSEEDEIKRAFELFDQNGGRIDPYELKTAMQALGYDTKNPAIYSLVAALDTPEAERNGGVTFEECEKAVNDKVGDNDSKENLRRIFDLLCDHNTDTITLDSCKAVSRAINQGMTDDEVTEMMKKACQGRTEMTFDEFCSIMTKSSK